MKKMLATVLTAGLTATAGAQEAKPRASVDVLFVLDTTGSMGGMLEAAKTKVWAIANEIAKGKPTPRIRVGLVAYRDRNDEYVTKVTDLTTDLDKMYAELLALKADGGGDTPEHVLKGLDDAAEKISWSSDLKTFKVLYLVGDAPAHTDYGDTPSMDAILQKLMAKGVVVNAVQCGEAPDTREQFARIARLGEGHLIALAQDAGGAAPSTPFDARLSELNGKLEGTTLAFGARREATMASLASVRGMMAKAAPAAAAERASFMAAGSGGFAAESDLLQAVEDKRADLGKLKDAELPQNLRGLDEAGRKAELGRIKAEREGLKKEIAKVAGERAHWLSKNVAPKKDAFDVKLVSALKEQAAKKGIAF